MIRFNDAHDRRGDQCVGVHEMSKTSSKSLMRSLGEFVGHIVHGVRTNPRKKTLKRTVEEEKDGNITLRRTTIEEIEVHPNSNRQQQ